MDECLGVILEYWSSRLNQTSQKLNSFVCMLEAGSKLKVPPCVSGIKLGSSSICRTDISQRNAGKNDTNASTGEILTSSPEKYRSIISKANL